MYFIAMTKAKQMKIMILLVVENTSNIVNSPGSHIDCFISLVISALLPGHPDLIQTPDDVGNPLPVFPDQPHPIARRQGGPQFQGQNLSSGGGWAVLMSQVRFAGVDQNFF